MIVAEFIKCCRTTFGIPHAIACQALGVSQSWFYKWINRAPTARQQRRVRLDAEIKRLFTASGGTYGSPRITDDLREADWKISPNTVAERIAALGVAGPPAQAAAVADPAGTAVRRTGPGAPHLHRCRTRRVVVR